MLIDEDGVSDNDEAVEPTSFSSLPSHVIVNILLRVMVSTDKPYDLRLSIMDLGSVSSEMKLCVSHATHLLHDINIDQGIDHRRSMGHIISHADDRLVSNIGKRCSQLKNLLLRCSEDITEQGLVELAEGCSSTLTKLVILSCNRIGSGRFLSSLCSLNHLELKWAYAILPYHLRPILPGLVVLNLHGCELINDDLFLNTSPPPPSNDQGEAGSKGKEPPLSLPFLKELDLAERES